MRQSVSRFRSVRIQRVHAVIRFLPFGVSTVIWCRLGFIFFGVRALRSEERRVGKECT